MLLKRKYVVKSEWSIVKNILVSGGAGYVGSHTVKVLLEEGFNVVVLDNLTTGSVQAVAPKAKFFYGDIGNRLFVDRVLQDEQIEAAIHFAAFSVVSDSIKRPDDYFQENVAKTNSFITALVKAGIDKLILSSTASVYGIPVDTTVSEDSSNQTHQPLWAFQANG